jgi:hypothetical protein
MRVVLPAPAFDGRTLNLAALAGDRALPSTALQLLSDQSGPATLWYTATAQGTASFRFTPGP